MLRVNGFYGHVRRNDLRSFAMFAGFIIAFEIVAAVALFPPLLFFDIKHAPLFSFGYVERYVPIVLVVGIALFLVRFSRHVASVQTTVAFAYVDRRTDPRLVNIVETQAIGAGLPAPRAGVIETAARNAFACGLTASSAVVVVTRGLLEALDDDELAAVVAHEVAHIRNGDIRLMAAANVLMENLHWVQSRNLLGGIGWKKAVVVAFLPALLFLFGMAGVLTRVAFTIARVSRLLISSSREFMADAEAVRLTHNPAALISALRRIEGRSAVPNLSQQADAMMIDGAVEGPFATHPTIAERIAVLEHLSGEWAEIDLPRKDTRAMPHAPAGRRRHGEPASARVGAPATPSEAAPPRFLFQRVNAGIRDDIYGMTPGAKWVLRIGLALLVGSTFLTMARLERAQERRDAEGRREVQNRVARASGNAAVSDDPARARALGTAIRTEAQRLSDLDPSQAKCFATAPYEVGDRGLRQLTTPDSKLVEAYARPEAHGSPGIILERYLGWRLRSLRAVAGAQDGELDAQLLSYVQTRKRMLEVLHRFFGEPGLQLIQQAYESSEDQVVLDMLRRRLQVGASALKADSRIAAEMQLLVSAPENFIPCGARARMISSAWDTR